MSIKKYGIYLAYPPTVDLRDQGLGRHLVEFLKAVEKYEEICFVIACPSWTKISLIELFKDANIEKDFLEIIAPRKQPLLLTVYEYYFKALKIFSGGNAQLKSYYYEIKKNILNLKCNPEYNKIRWIAFSIIIAPFFLVVRLISFLFSFFMTSTLSLKSFSFITKLWKRVSPEKKIIGSLKDNLTVLELWKILRKRETKLVNNLINLRSDITAWYCPAAFWPQFNNIKAPRLMCVPDVVLADFPISFARISVDRTVDSFREVEESIKNGEYFVTYSEDVKWRTLVQRYHIDPEKTFVVPHGANFMNEAFKLSSCLSSNEAMSNVFCERLLKNALYKSMNPISPYFLSENSKIKYIFYASQIRPNKNVFSLLRAYNYLLKRRYIGHKLILTGSPHVLPEINEYVCDHNLTNDVLFLHGLSTRELAACYKLADLAVNPSLSEGGFPFTFTEALSVDTPVVMARIPVTLEVIKDPDLDQDMLFDPYDWKDMADRIEWGLQNKESLLAKQKIFYDVLKQRTWKTVVDEYIAILDRISTKDSDQKRLEEAA